jgi:C4-dicarboxylate transporter DctM subunit
MTVAVAVAIIVVLFAIGVPLYIVFGLGGLIILTSYAGMSLEQLGAMLFNSIDVFVLLAVPLFILAGNLMVQEGIGEPLVMFLRSFAGRIPGGLGIASILACLFVGALTGAIPATLAAVGIIMFPLMVETGYPKGFSSGILCGASHLGNLIPPSLGFILYGFITSTSVPRLFIAGILPGVLVATALSITALIIAKKNNFPVIPPISFRERGKLFIKALPALFMPVIILGSIYGGIASPTEAAAMACVYCFAIAPIVSGSIKWKGIWAALTNTVRTSTSILIIIVAAIVLGKAFTLTGLTRAITDWVISAELGTMGFLLLVTFAFIVITFIMESTAMIFIFVPLILSAASALDINLIHLGVIIIIAGSIGATTPPMAVHLYITSGILKVPVEDVMRGTLPFLITLIVILFIVVFFPQISIWLPNIMMGS